MHMLKVDKMCVCISVTLEARYMFLYLHIQSVQKETQTFKWHFLGVKFIDCKNDSISVALPFNKELYGEVLS